MTKKEFITEAIHRGYCQRGSAEKFADITRKEVYEENDLIEAYRYAERCISPMGSPLPNGGRTSKHYCNVSSDKR